MALPGTGIEFSSLYSQMKTLTIHPSFLVPGVALRLASGLGLVAVIGFSSPALSASPLLADLSLNVRIDEAPPPARHEEIIERNRPGPDFVWTEGFWDGSPGHYAWVGGHWDRPPHPHARWFAPHWEKDHDGHFHQIKGEWR
jgi:hypothetical protein